MHRDFVWKVRGKELSAARQELDFTSQQLAEASGLHIKTIQKLERQSDTRVGRQTAESLLLGLGRSPDNLRTPVQERSVDVGLIFSDGVRTDFGTSGRAESLTRDWQAWLKRRRLVSDATVVAYECCLRRLEAHSGFQRDELTILQVEDYLRDGNISHATKQQTFVAFMSFHKWGALQAHWSMDPELMDLKVPKVRRGPRPALEAHVARRMLDACETSAQVRLGYLGLYAGLRVGEIARLDVENWSGSVIKMTVKGGWPHEIPVHPELMARREEILADTPHRRQVQRASTYLRRFADGQEVTPHWLRRTFAQRLAQLGVQREVIGALLGHSTSSITTAHYAPVTFLEMAEAVKKLHY